MSCCCWRIRRTGISGRRLTRLMLAALRSRAASSRVPTSELAAINRISALPARSSGEMLHRAGVWDPSTSCYIELVFFRILADESVAVGHLHFGQRLRVHDLIFADNLVEGEYIGGQCVHFIIGKCLRLLLRHGAPCEVENGGGIGPIVANQLHGVTVSAVERPSAYQWPARSSAALVAVAERASTFGVNRGALRWCPAARRQTDAVRRDADVPGRKIGRRDWLSVSRCFAGIGHAERK